MFSESPRSKRLTDGDRCGSGAGSGVRSGSGMSVMAESAIGAVDAISGYVVVCLCGTAQYQSPIGALQQRPIDAHSRSPGSDSFAPKPVKTHCVVQSFLTRLLTKVLPGYMVLPKRLEINIPPAITAVAEAAVGRDAVMKAVASAVLQVCLSLLCSPFVICVAGRCIGAISPGRFAFGSTERRRRNHLTQVFSG